jgi:hypothetical protein
MMKPTNMTQTTDEVIDPSTGRSMNGTPPSSRTWRERHAGRRRQDHRGLRLLKDRADCRRPGELTDR